MSAATGHPYAAIDFDQQPVIWKTEVGAMTPTFVLRISRISERELRHARWQLMRHALKCEFPFEFVVLRHISAELTRRRRSLACDRAVSRCEP